VGPRGLAVTLCLEDLQSINPIRSYSSVFLAASRGSKVDDLFECECVLRIVGWSAIIANLPRSNSIKASCKAVGSRAFRSTEEHLIKGA